MNYKIYTLLVFFFINTFALGNLIRPASDDNLNYIHILFEWEQEPDAIGYNLQVSTQEFFNNLILDVNETTTVYIDKDNFNWNDNYYWRVRSILDCVDCDYGDWIGTSEFSIGGTSFQNISVDIYEEELLEDGYVAIGGFAPELASVIIDQYGDEIWNDGDFDFLLNRINENGNIFGFSSTNYPFNTGMKSNTDMDVVWSTLDIDPLDMHEFKQISNGNYMGFTREDVQGPIPSDNYMTQYFQMIGYQADGVTPEFPWFGQKIVEWNEDHEVIWSWNPFDHFTMDDFDNYETTWYEAYFNQEYDWMHSNAFHFDEQESVIYVSHRHLSRITKISYPSGDVIWNMGLPSEYNTGDENICTDLLFSFQHNIQLLDDGNLIFFDNGNLSEMLLGDSSPTTRIRRIRVIDNSYCETVWQYDLPQNLYGLGMGSVQLLDNGNYSIYTFGSGLNDPECSVIEVTPDKDIIWKATGNPNVAWYRAYKIPQLHPDAFSVLGHGYTITEDQNTIELSGNSLNFTIINQSGYALPYRYMFSDLMDGGTQLFIYDEGVVDIEPFGSYDLSFSTNNEASITATQIMLSIWPIRHEYALKELMFTVSLVSSSLAGDLNSDGIVNVLDVVGLINIVLGTADENTAGDLNGDGLYNVLDVVILVNIILDS